MIAVIAFAGGLATGLGTALVVANIAIKRFFDGLNAVNESIGFHAADPEHPRLRVVGGDS